jgi:hypothetical protein
MKPGRSLTFLAIVIFLAACFIPARSGAARAPDECFNQYQIPIPCPEQKTPRPKKTPIPPTLTFTATATVTSSPTPAPTGTSIPTATVDWAVNQAGPLVVRPVSPTLQSIPPIVFAAGGLWLLVFLGLISAWRAAGRSSNQSPPSPPQDPRRKRPTKKAWGVGVLLWLLIGVTIIAWRNPLPGWLRVCGVDDFPDLVPTHVDFSVSNTVSFTVSNSGVCSAPPSVGLLYWDTTEAAIKLKTLTPATSDATGVEVIIPSLASGETRVIKLFLARSYTTFHGKSWAAFSVDFRNHVRESNETNNTLIFKP